MISEHSNQTIFNNWKQAIASNVERIIQNKLEYQSYNPIKTKQITNQLGEEVIKFLSSTNKNFKYIVNCTIVATGGNGLDMVGLCYWDHEMDGTLTVKWENKNIVCIINVYGCAI